MKRPAFQFYPADWRNNAKLRRCSWAARGVWIEVLGLMHDEDEYGVLRWPLADIAIALGAPIKLLRELADKLVLKGGDRKVDAYVYTPRHGGRNGMPVVLIEANNGPCWYSSRFVRDEYLRNTRGASTRFGGNGGGKASPDPSPNPIPTQRQGSPPTQREGARQGYGASTASSLNTNGVGLTIPPAVDKSPPSDQQPKVKTNWAMPHENQHLAQWWRTDQGIDAKGKELGMRALPAETYPAYKDRIFMKLRDIESQKHAVP